MGRRPRREEPVPFLANSVAQRERLQTPVFGSRTSPSHGPGALDGRAEELDVLRPAARVSTRRPRPTPAASREALDILVLCHADFLASGHANSNLGLATESLRIQVQGRDLASRRRSNFETSA